MEMKSKPASRKRSASTRESAAPSAASARRVAKAAEPEEETAAKPAEVPTIAAPATAAEAEVEEAPKVIMSRAQRRKLKKPPVIVTTAMKEKALEEKRELRKYLRMIKSNGSRRKVAKLAAKRLREEHANEEDINAFDSDYRPRKLGRRLEN